MFVTKVENGKKTTYKPNTNK